MLSPLPSSNGSIFSTKALARLLKFSTFFQTRKKEAVVLYTHYPNYTSMTNSAGPEFVMSGRRIDTNMDEQTTYGYSWSNAAYTTDASAYDLVLNSAGAVHPAGQSGKHSGRPLRCLAEVAKSGPGSYLFFGSGT